MQYPSPFRSPTGPLVPPNPSSAPAKVWAGVAAGPPGPLERSAPRRGRRGADAQGGDLEIGEPVAVEVGDRAPAPRAAALSGRDHQLPDLRARVVVPAGRQHRARKRGRPGAPAAGGVRAARRERDDGALAVPIATDLDAHGIVVAPNQRKSGRRDVEIVADSGDRRRGPATSCRSCLSCLSAPWAIVTASLPGSSGGSPHPADATTRPFPCPRSACGVLSWRDAGGRCVVSGSVKTMPASLSPICYRSGGAPCSGRRRRGGGRTAVARGWRGAGVQSVSARHGQEYVVPDGG